MSDTKRSQGARVGGISAVMDPLRYPAKNGGESVSSDSKNVTPSHKPSNTTHNRYLSYGESATNQPNPTRPNPVPSSSKPIEATSSTDLTNTTVKNITNSIQTNRVHANRLAMPQLSGSSTVSATGKLSAVTDTHFVSYLTSALQQTKELEEVDLDDNSSAMFNQSLHLKRNILTRTPANSVDVSQNTKLRSLQDLDSQSLTSLNFSLPASQIYEPETVDLPSSPGEMSSSLHHMRLTDPTLAGDKDIDSGCVFTASASPPTASVSMKKTPQTLTLNNLDGASSSTSKPLKKLMIHPEDLRYNGPEDGLPSLADDEVSNIASMSDINTPDDIDTPDEFEASIMEQLAAKNQTSHGDSHSARVIDLADNNLSFRSIIIQGIERRIDMQVIEPYKKVLSHGGHLDSGEAIIVFSACFLPDRARHDYDYVMDHLFMYVLTALDQLIAEDYVLVYLHGATTRANMPSFNWLKRCYQMIDRRLRKNLQVLYLVHPTFWVKTVVVMIRPFVSAKFSRKLRFVTSLQDLADLIPMEQVCIPTRIKQYDEIRENLLTKDQEKS